MSRTAVSILASLFFLFFCSVSLHAEPSADNYNISSDQGQQFNLSDNEISPKEEFEEQPVDTVFDPLSGYNRVMTVVNDKLYFWALKPLARGLAWIIPKKGRLAINRCFRNLMFPVRFVNNLLQLKIKRVGIESARFGVNTTIGILGFSDPAKNWLGLKAYDEDFGQTMGHYGLGGGFHLVLPVFGPSNVRDAIGMVPDFFLNPLSYIDDNLLETGIKAFEEINYTSLHIGEYESFKNDALDLYEALRDAYEQNRKKKIKE
ncbi:VacJ family lipoprotein (fragment) [uncultured Desulfobacterium sp.]|uniref:VacJ family lipoprotein n=1 Tax=uncultured Desulfobacterium sp. TaxID=201089 RepID=A0A445N2S6_9BACT